MKVLALRGGGVRGVLQARLLARLEEESPGWVQEADVMAGTSVGGITALGLAAGMDPAQVLGLLSQALPKVFHDSAWDDLRDLSLGGVSLLGAQYSNEPLLEALEDAFGSMRLQDLNCEVLVPCFDLDAVCGVQGWRSWRPKFFDRSDDALVKDVAAMTSAAPTYLPSFMGMVDGGLVANDPSTCALVHALSKGAALGQIRLLTVGTGTCPQHVEGLSNDWGLKQWARHLVDAVLEGGVLVPVRQATQILGERYHLLDPRLQREVALDGDGWRGPRHLRECLDELSGAAEEHDLSRAVRWLEEEWRGS